MLQVMQSKTLDGLEGEEVNTYQYDGCMRGEG